jgi:lipoyl synthase
LFLLIRLSYGTAACLGLVSGRTDTYPTTAYLLSGNNCLMKCAFCSQGADKKAFNRLGRIKWPEYTWDEVSNILTRAEDKGIHRICLQSVKHADGIMFLLKTVERIKAVSSLPLSVSAWIRNKEEAVALRTAGVDRISVSLDVVNPEAYEKIKGGSFQNRLELLLSCAQALPGQISTHIICGLGETDEETLILVDRLIQADITVALFAFMPLKGTPMEKVKPPSVNYYRRIQAGSYLLREKIMPLSAFIFSNGSLVSYGLPEKELNRIFSGGAAFQTSGCPDCNRPYYNERPGGVIYNYHRPLNNSELRAALLESLPCRQKEKVII